MAIQEIQKTKLPGIKMVLGVLSGKGGVGKTFVSCSLALTLAKLGKKIGLLDADISCPNIFKMLGIQTKLPLTPDNKIIPIEKWGLKIVSMAGLCNTQYEPIAWRGPILSKIIQKFLKESLWGELDVLIIDFPTGTTDSSLTILQNFDVNGVIIVTMPQEISLLDAARTINVASMLKIPVIGIVENMRGEIFGEGGANKLANMFSIPCLGSIPMRKQITQMCDNGTPPIFHMEELEMIFTRISRSILEKKLVEL